MKQPHTDLPGGITVGFAAGVIALMASAVTASDLVEIQPLTDRILMLHFNDGHAQHHQRGQPRSEQKVFVDPLDVGAAARSENYTVTSADDPAYRESKSSLSVSRKSKGTDFAWFVDKWNPPDSRIECRGALSPQGGRGRVGVMRLCGDRISAIRRFARCECFGGDV
jgi:hypothetical protein